MLGISLMTAGFVTDLTAEPQETVISIEAEEQTEAAIRDRIMVLYLAGGYIAFVSGVAAKCILDEKNQFQRDGYIGRVK